MTLVPLFDLTQQFNNKNGAVLVGGKLYVYYVGRTDLATTWADEDASATNTNPVLLDNNGRAPVFVDDSYAYTLVVCDRSGAELFSQDITPGGAGSVGGRIVYHDETLTGNGTVASLLGANTFPLGVDETMTAYTGVAEGRDALILGVNGDWFSANFLSGLNNKVDWSAFNSAYYGLKGDISSKADWSALNNYFTKNETTYMLSDYIKTSAMTNILQNYYTIPQTDALLDQKQDKLTFEYNDSSAISSINGSALAGSDGGNCPWISGTKVIADTQTLTSNMIIQVLSSFTMSGDHNHFIGMKGGTYRFPNEYEIGSALLHTNYFMHLSGMSGYLPISSFSSYTASIANNLENNWNYTNSAYGLSINNFYNKLDASAFSSYSAGQDTTINNITEQITNISNASGDWNDISAYQQNSANYLTGINIQESASWNEATNVVQTNSSNWNNKLDLTAFENLSGEFYPMTGNPSGFLTAHQSLDDYYKKTETSSKEQISAAIDSIPQGDPDVNNFVQTNSSTILDVDNVVQTNSAQWAENTGDIQVNNYVYNNSGINNEVNNVVTANSGVWNNVTNKLDTTAFTAWSSTIFSGDYELSAGDGIALVDDVQNKITRIDFTGTSGPDLSAGEGIGISTIDGKTVITNNISAGQGVSLVYDVETNTYRIDGEGRGYSGVAPVIVDNSNNLISITGESLSAGPNIDIFSSGGYVVISANGGNTYCYNFPNGVTSVDLANFNNYNKVTVVHNNDYGPDYHLYWDGKTKVMPSGLYCEMVKGKDDQNNIKWSFASSGWTNEVWWDWD